MVKLFNVYCSPKIKKALLNYEKLIWLFSLFEKNIIRLKNFKLDIFNEFKLQRKMPVFNDGNLVEK